MTTYKIVRGTLSLGPAGMWGVQSGGVIFDYPLSGWRVADLTGRHVAFGARGSGLVILARYVLDGLGLDQSRTSIRSSSTPPAMAPMVLDGRVAALWGGGIGWPGFAAVARARGGGFIVPDPEEAAASSPSTPSSSR